MLFKKFDNLGRVELKKIKKATLIIFMILISMLSMLTLVSCDDGDTDDDGFTDDFEVENGLDPNEYNWNEDFFE